jgi:uncharacterized protein (TIGR03118 family)
MTSTDDYNEVIRHLRENFPGFYPIIVPTKRRNKKKCKCKDGEESPKRQQCAPVQSYVPCPPCPPIPPAPPTVPPILPPLIPFGKRAITTWRINYLVSNKFNDAAHIDEDLLDPWGIAILNTQLWVINDGTDVITNYDLFGNKLLGSIDIRESAHHSSHPTGIAINCNGGFSITDGVNSKSSIIMTATKYSTVHGFNPSLDPQYAYIVLDGQLTGQVIEYRGLTIVNGILYLADFFGRKIDVYDSNYVKLANFPFVDGDTCDPIPMDYGPNNIVNIGCYLFVIWAKKDPTLLITDLPGPGNGYISVFNLDGSFVRRFTSRGVLNSPWGMIPAPAECGFPPGSFLVANNGDGRINVFDCDGRYVGPMLNQCGIPIVIEGLRGLAPYYVPGCSEIYFTAAADENIDGLVGSLVPDCSIII